jgi:Cd(II)/Pb(II)-responsive transcriptional regulator
MKSMIMKIGELASITGCSIQTIRYYEKANLLPLTQRSEGNFRLYDKATVDLLLFIKHCRSLDLSLPEIRQLLALNRSPGAQCEEVNRMMDAQIQQVEDRIAELTQLRAQLKTLRRSCSSERTIAQCGILQNLTTSQNSKP